MRIIFRSEGAFVGADGCMVWFPPCGIEDIREAKMIEDWVQNMKCWRMTPRVIYHRILSKYFVLRHTESSVCMQACMSVHVHACVSVYLGVLCSGQVWVGLAQLLYSCVTNSCRWRHENKITVKTVCVEWTADWRQDDRAFVRFSRLNPTHPHTPQCSSSTQKYNE